MSREGRHVRLHVVEGEQQGVVVTSDRRPLLWLTPAVALRFADELTIVAERLHRRTLEPAKEAA